MRDKEDAPHVARRICIGWIVSDEYIQRITPFWRPDLLDTDLSRILCGWCYDYHQQYNTAPKGDIESIFHERKDQLDPDLAEQIEILLESLSEEYDREVFNVEYLLDQTRKYFQEQHVRRYIEEATTKVERGEVTEADAQLSSYSPAYRDTSSYIDPFSPEAGPALRAAFETRKEPLIKYAFALGKFWNHELVRDAFVTFMAREKGGKSWLLMDAAIRAARRGCNTVFFQAGDMTENQMLRRIGIYTARRSDQERYCKDIWIPTLDCVNHQMDRCERKQRERSRYSESVLEDPDTFESLQEAAIEYPKHSPCHNCEALRGSPWLQKSKDQHPLSETDIEGEVTKFRRVVKGRMRLSTHANESLSVTQIKAQLDQWEREENFVADVIVIDYADILAPCQDFSRMDFRHQQNRIWQRLRNLSQERHCLLITATQAKATAYTKELLDLSDYSEDKRKWAHCTAAFGLNQTPEEKRIGIMRINTLLVRDADYNSDRPVHVLQRLQIGRPVLESYL